MGETYKVFENERGPEWLYELVRELYCIWLLLWLSVHIGGVVSILGLIVSIRELVWIFAWVHY